MLRALLLDLDDTLLDNPMSTFIPAYFAALTDYVRGHVEPAVLEAALWRGMAAMEANDGTGPSNEEAFATVFFPALGRERSELEPVFDRFYAESFPELRRLTAPRPEASRLVRWARSRAMPVVIATNSVFPAVAIEERLRWAGVPAETSAFALVTSYEVMHATKSTPAYYREIVARLGVQPDECLMVGDDPLLDIASAAAAGIPGFWVSAAGPRPGFGGASPVAEGTLADLESWLASTAEAAPPSGEEPNDE